MVPTPVASATPAPITLASATWNCSFASNVVSPWTWTVNVYVVAPDGKVTPVGPCPM